MKSQFTQFSLLCALLGLTVLTGCSRSEPGNPVNSGAATDLSGYADFVTEPAPEQNLPLTISGATQLGFNQAFTLQVNIIDGAVAKVTPGAAGGDKYGYRLSASNLPIGASFVDNGDGSGLFSWSTEYGDLGEYPVSFGAALNGSDLGVSAPVKLSVKTTGWYDNLNCYRGVVDASDYVQTQYYRFADQDTVTAASAGGSATDWTVAFKRTTINLNGGLLSEGGSAIVGANLGAVDFESVNITDTTGVTWVEDARGLVVTDWYEYNFVTHTLDMTQHVYTGVDAYGGNFYKFRVDSLVGAGAPPSMGTVYISYFYQSEPGSMALVGSVQQAAISVGAGIGYFDFSSGAQVYPGNPQDSKEWDISFVAYELRQNSGPNGSGYTGAFPVYETLSDPTDIYEVTAHPGAPVFPDITTSVFQADPLDNTQSWYVYDPISHQITSRGNVYLIKIGSDVYKLNVGNYYFDPGTGVEGAHYTIDWVKL